MNIELLRASNLRCFESVAFAPEPGINWLVGVNGSGKTTLLEAAYILSHGRSFRAGGRAAPRQHGTSEYLIHAEIARAGKPKTRIGLARTEDRWLARMNDEDLPNLARLFGACPVVYFGPESQSLILGPAEERRAYLDWAVFHVEHASLDLWRSWRRALRQRNTLLRQGAPAADFEPWDHDLGRLAERIHVMRGRVLDTLAPYLLREAENLVPELGGLRIDYRPGWDEQSGLTAQLAATRDRDRERGFTRYGAHRADWALAFENVAQREHLSRGQAKAAALVCMLALTCWLEDQVGDYPLLCLDDLESEFDAAHAALVVRWLSGKRMQSWVTSTQNPDTSVGGKVFHVEHLDCKRTVPSA